MNGQLYSLPRFFSRLRHVRLFALANGGGFEMAWHCDLRRQCLRARWGASILLEILRAVGRWCFTHHGCEFASYAGGTSAWNGGIDRHPFKHSGARFCFANLRKRVFHMAAASIFGASAAVFGNFKACTFQLERVRFSRHGRQWQQLMIQVEALQFHDPMPRVNAASTCSRALWFVVRRSDYAVKPYVRNA